MTEARAENDGADRRDALFDLAIRHLEGRLTDAGRGRLDGLLTKDEASRDAFVAICVQACLLASGVGIDDAGPTSQPAPENGCRPRASERPAEHRVKTEPVTLSAARYFFNPVAMAYSIAFVLLGLGLLAGYRFALRDPAAPPSAVANRTAPEPGETPVVPPIQTGKITAMKDCQWADPASAAKEMRAGKFALASGIVELTYNSGVKVSLKGPVLYASNVRNGGFLYFGSLTMDTGSSGAKPESAAPQKPQASDYPPFTIRTPTTIVNDQGCRCAVTVDERGTASVRVFRGRVFLLSPDARCKDVTCLGEGDFAWTEIRNGRELVEHSWTWKRRPPSEFAGSALKEAPVYSLHTKDRGRTGEKVGQDNSRRS